MILKLGDIDLNPNMHIPELDQSFGVAMSYKQTLSGGVRVFQGSVTAGRRLTLIATNDQGWITKENRDKLLDLASRVGEPLTLDSGNESYNVMLDHSEGSAVSLTPFVHRRIPLKGDYYTGTIKLITI